MKNKVELSNETKAKINIIIASAMKRKNERESRDKTKKQYLFAFQFVSWVLVVCALFALFVWPAPQGRKNSAEREQIEAKNRSENISNVIQSALPGSRNDDIDPKMNYGPVKDASKDEIAALIDKCRDAIRSEFVSGSVHYRYAPYTAAKLREFSNLTWSISGATIVPSLVIDPEDTRGAEEKQLRETLPPVLDLAYEGVSDGFFGMRTWAAVFRCEYLGRKVVSVKRPIHFYTDGK